MHWWKYYGLTLAVVCAYAPFILWLFLRRRNSAKITLLLKLYAPSFAIFLMLFYIGAYLAALTDGV